MDISIGLPNTIRGVTGSLLLDWARAAEDAGFASLATIGAVEYPSYEELTVFAAAGAVTQRIRFFSNVLIAPPRSAAELAKQAATTDQLTGGRLSLGMGVGWRSNDFALTGRSYEERGNRFDQQLIDLKRAWAGEPLVDGARPVSPAPAQDPHPPLIIGGTADAAVRRVVEHGDGWTAGGMPPDAVAVFAGRVREAWQEAGRNGAPRICALAYFGLGNTEQESMGNLLDYYGPMGQDTAQMIAGSAMRSADEIRGALAAFERAGVDEFVLNPSVGQLSQLELLADIAFG